jgi:hypothetical protein
MQIESPSVRRLVRRTSRLYVRGIRLAQISSIFVPLSLCPLWSFLIVAVCVFAWFFFGLPTGSIGRRSQMPSTGERLSG